MTSRKSRRILGCGWNKVNSRLSFPATFAVRSLGRVASFSKPPFSRPSSAAAAAAAAMAPADDPPTDLRR